MDAGSSSGIPVGRRRRNLNVLTFLFHSIDIPFF